MVFNAEVRSLNKQHDSELWLYLRQFCGICLTKVDRATTSAAFYFLGSGRIVRTCSKFERERTKLRRDRCFSRTQKPWKKEGDIELFEGGDIPLKASNVNISNFNLKPHGWLRAPSWASSFPRSLPRPVLELLSQNWV
jgi:hypothetical protein